MNLQKNIIFPALVAATLVCFTACTKVKKDITPWVDMFDGNTLNGWSAIGGTASYEVKEGIIVGTSTPNTPNTFLCTDKMYGDFILELDYKVDPKLNSGIQIRSNSIDSYRNGVVHGYQIEIDPSERAWSAGLYDEQRRGWLVPLTNNPTAQKAFKQDQWNHYRIEAIGDTIKTWINGVPAAYLIDDMTSTGFIGLQVHSIGTDREKEGTQVAWKNVKIISENVQQYSQKMSLDPVITKNNLFGKEAEEGWKMLWDGKTTQGWKGAKLDDFPESGWEINDGVLSVLASGGGESRAGGDIVTTDLYSDFELKLDFKITEGANSGIKYYVNTELNKGEGSSIGLEFQILDDERHPDAKLGNHKGSRTIGSLYDLIQADTNKVVHPIGEWNQARIVSKNNHVEHWLNGRKVLEYERKSPEYLQLVKESKYVKWPNFGEADQGRILLQDHGDFVSFRNIKIRSLK
ncbi:3-keto-disaccharide hydrolase [Lutimonas sp.]|uniref:3-keto-disaccharide hydrolase n=1 Tax=Lutimonas sp. TaxID=1872403 RepID=UPI003C773DDF